MSQDQDSADPEFEMMRECIRTAVSEYIAKVYRYSEVILTDEYMTYFGLSGGPEVRPVGDYYYETGAPTDRLDAAAINADLLGSISPLGNDAMRVILVLGGGASACILALRLCTMFRDFLILHVDNRAPAGVYHQANLTMHPIEHKVIQEVATLNNYRYLIAGDSDAVDQLVEGFSIPVVIFSDGGAGSLALPKYNNLVISESPAFDITRQGHKYDVTTGDTVASVIPIDHTLYIDVKALVLRRGYEVTTLYDPVAVDAFASITGVADGTAVTSQSLINNLHTALQGTTAGEIMDQVITIGNGNLALEAMVRDMSLAVRDSIAIDIYNVGRLPVVRIDLDACRPHIQDSLVSSWVVGMETIVSTIRKIGYCHQGQYSVQEPEQMPMSEHSLPRVYAPGPLVPAINIVRQRTPTVKVIDLPPATTQPAVYLAWGHIPLPRSVTCTVGAEYSQLSRVTIGLGQIKYNGVALPKIKHIASGSYGAVYLFGSGSNQFAVKIMDPKDPEYDTVMSITASTSGRLIEGEACGLINAVAGQMTINYDDYPEVRKADQKQLGLVVGPHARLPRHASKNITVMNFMSGTVGDLLKLLGRHISIKAVCGIAKILFENAMCLSSMGYVYSDYKVVNMLYRCEGGERARITYSDIGGLVKKVSSEIFMSCTMPPPEIFVTGKYGHAVPSDKIMVWGCAACMVESFTHVNRSTSAFLTRLYHGKMTEVSYASGYTAMVRGIIRQRDIFIQEGKYDGVKLNDGTSLGDFFRGTLEPDPRKRWSLRRALATLG
jgi:hypothetical protein